jgi:hypothetical protein
MSEPDDARWHLDKRVPLALIVTIAIQTGTFIWWASSLTERVNTLERERVATAPQGERLTRVEVKLEGVQVGIDEIKRLLRRETP